MLRIVAALLFFVALTIPAYSQEPSDRLSPVTHWYHSYEAKPTKTAKVSKNHVRHVRRGYERSVPTVVVQSGPPSGCPSRAWCGCWLAKHLGLNDRALWLAREWARIGSAAAGPAPGVVAVWPHHVGIVRRVTGPGRAVILSGNDGRAVRERERSTRGVIAWRYVSQRFAEALP